VGEHRKKRHKVGLRGPSDRAASPDGPRSKQSKRGRHARRRSTGSRIVRWTVGALGLTVVVLAASVVGYAWYLNHQIQRIQIKDLSASPKKGVDLNTENILMIGSTSRCALTVQSQAYGLCSQGVDGVNSDVVMILHLNPNTHTLSILSLPRDLFVPNARADGANKIDAALYEGPSQLIAAIQEDFGIPIQHFVELNFDSFINVVNALGGIKMYFPEPVYDAYSGLNVQTTGCLSLNGTEALQVVRARHLQYKDSDTDSDDPAYWPQEGQSDIARIRRDHEFLRVLATAVQQGGISNPLTDQRLISSVAGQLVVDQGLTASAMLNLVLTYHTVTVDSVPQLTLPVAVDQFGDYYYEGGDYGDIEFPAEPQDHQAIDQFLGLSADDDTFAGGALPLPTSITVAVMNGSGSDNQATETANSLKALGFQIGRIGNTEMVGQEAETVVYYPSHSASALADAQAVENAMSGAVILAYDPALVAPGSQVTVVTGTDFSVNPPTVPAVQGTTTTTSPGSSTVSTTTTTTTATTTTTTTTTVPAGSLAFAKPTPTFEPLAPWDPRSCTAAGGEGP
jgi:LCP family protein required for cell wall assembly